MFIIQVFFQFHRIFVHNATILPKIAKHGPVDHGIIAYIFVILWTKYQCVKCSTHDLKKLDTTNIFF